MRTKKNLLALVAGLIACLIVVWVSTSTQGGERRYEIRPEISLPEYRTDAARAIDAYEYMMDRYMSMSEKNLTGINTDVRDIAKKLDSIEHKLTKLSTAMARIEKVLGVGQPGKNPVKKTHKAKSNNCAAQPALSDRK